ncbi:MAG: lysophospholipid acyltransferase family protein [Pseudomonadota bacterium]|nr:lysophospholipid acyltransferase family protein [Pseudomonadota bacterium]
MIKKANHSAQGIPQSVIDDVLESSLNLDETKLGDLYKRLNSGMRLFSKTLVTGKENIPEGPVLFISNHSTMAMDAFVLLPALQQTTQRPVRAMNDALFYRNETTKNVMVFLGCVMGNQRIGAALLEAGKDVLLFPGGAHEANKNLSERYTLKWKQRTGFVRLAAKAGVPIVPVGIVGPDEWFDRYMDRESVAKSWIGSLLKKLGVSQEYLTSDQMIPIPRGIFGTLIPKPKNSYVSIGEPIDMSDFKGEDISQADQERVRDLTKERLESCIVDMLLQQSQDRGKEGLFRKILSF